MKINKIHMVIVTGLSGSGKSTVIKAFEDIDYFCIDNLPVPLLPEFLRLCENDMPDIQRVALGIDIRERAFLNAYETIFNHLENQGYKLEIIFVEASSEVLQKRFSQTRRVHPLASSHVGLKEAISQEKFALKALRNRATRVIDTSAMTVHQLKNLITRIFSLVPEKHLLSIQVMSFGFKYGIPLEADLVMDVRFLPNPYFIDELRHLDGQSQEICNWVLRWPITQEFINDYTSLLNKLIPLYIQEGKRYLTIAIGCTGGKHRSVVIAQQIADKLRSNDYNIYVNHRDIGLE